MSEWKKVEGFPQYSVSIKGHVRNDATGYILNPKPDLGAYPMIVLCNGTNGRSRYRVALHRVVAMAWVPGRTSERRYVHHIDEDKSNAVARNLRWVTPSENAKYSYPSRGPLTPHRYMPPDTYAQFKWRSVRDLPGFEKCLPYEVSDRGDVTRLSGQRLQWLWPNVMDSGYHAVHLTMETGDSKTITVHRLVALAFVPGRTAHRNCVNHIDHVRGNNLVENLEWCSHKENREHGNHVKPDRIVADLKSGLKHKEIAIKHGVCTGTVSGIAIRTGNKRDMRVSGEDRKAIVADLATEKTSVEVAKEYGITTETVRRICREFGVKGGRGTALKAAHRDAIQRDIVAGEVSFETIARRHDVSPPTVSRIAREMGIVRKSGPIPRKHLQDQPTP